MIENQQKRASIGFLLLTRLCLFNTCFMLLLQSHAKAEVEKAPTNIQSASLVQLLSLFKKIEWTAKVNVHDLEQRLDSVNGSIVRAGVSGFYKIIRSDLELSYFSGMREQESINEFGSPKFRLSGNVLSSKDSLFDSLWLHSSYAASTVGPARKVVASHSSLSVGASAQFKINKIDLALELSNVSREARGTDVSLVLGDVQQFKVRATYLLPRHWKADLKIWQYWVGKSQYKQLVLTESQIGRFAMPSVTHKFKDSNFSLEAGLILPLQPTSEEQSQLLAAGLRDPDMDAVEGARWSLGMSAVF